MLKSVLIMTLCAAQAQFRRASRSPFTSGATPLRRCCHRCTSAPSRARMHTDAPLQTPLSPTYFNVFGTLDYLGPLRKVQIWTLNPKSWTLDPKPCTVNAVRPGGGGEGLAGSGVDQLGFQARAGEFIFQGSGSRVQGSKPPQASFDHLMVPCYTT